MNLLKYYNIYKLHYFLGNYREWLFAVHISFDIVSVSIFIKCFSWQHLCNYPANWRNSEHGKVGCVTVYLCGDVVPGTHLQFACHYQFVSKNALWLGSDKARINSIFGDHSMSSLIFSFSSVGILLLSCWYRNYVDVMWIVSGAH